MTAKHWLQLAAVAIALVFVVSVLLAWRSELRERADLKQQLQTLQQSLTEAAAREQARDAAAQKQVQQWQRQAAKVQSPQDVLKALPTVLPLPEPITMETPSVGATPKASASPQKPSAPQAHTAGFATIPVGDLKPLYNAAVACKECQTELTAAQADLKDEQTKTQALSRERDDALRAAKGGSVLRRVARAAKWFFIGAAAGAVAVKFAR